MQQSRFHQKTEHGQWVREKTMTNQGVADGVMDNHTPMMARHMQGLQALRVRELTLKPTLDVSG